MKTIEVKKLVAEYLANGVSLSDIQNHLRDEHDVTMTFLDLRLLASELENVDWGQTKEEELKEKAENEPEEEPEIEETGKTVVEVNKLQRPGALASGSVKFASGATAEWVLDQMGRLGLDKSVGKPTEEDIKEFQEELQKAITGQR